MRETKTFLYVTSYCKRLGHLKSISYHRTEELTSTESQGWAQCWMRRGKEKDLTSVSACKDKKKAIAPFITFTVVLHVMWNWASCSNSPAWTYSINDHRSHLGQEQPDATVLLRQTALQFHSRQHQTEAQYSTIKRKWVLMSKHNQQNDNASLIRDVLQLKSSL